MGDERRINQLTTKAYDNIGSSDYFAVDNASEAESKKLPASSIKTPISNLQGEVTGGSDTYSSTKNYSVGMYVTHTTSGVQKLYRCKTACTAASWTTNASCFEEANLADAVSQLNNDLTQKENKLADSGWLNLRTDFIAKYRKYGKVVEVSINTQTSGVPSGSAVIGTLPEGYRPSLYMRVPCRLGNNQTAIGSMEISTNGAITAINSSGSTEQYFMGNTIFIV